VSTSYRPLREIPVGKLKAAASEMGLMIHYGDPRESNHVTSFALTDGKNYLWCSYYASEYVSSFDRYGANDVEDIIDKISSHLGVDIISEHDPAYWEDEDACDDDESE